MPKNFSLLQKAVDYASQIFKTVKALLDFQGSVSYSAQHESAGPAAAEGPHPPYGGANMASSGFTSSMIGVKGELLAILNELRWMTTKV
jgi:hypothetical protein